MPHTVLGSCGAAAVAPCRLSLCPSICLSVRLLSFKVNKLHLQFGTWDRRPTTSLDCECDWDGDGEPHQSPSVRIKCLWLLVFVQNLNLMSDPRQMAAISRHVQRKAL